MLATRGLPVLIELGLLIYCLIEAIQTPEAEVRNLPRWAWILLILLIPIIGSVSWLIGGRPLRPRGRRGAPWPAGPTAGYPEYERPGSPMARGPAARGPMRGPDDDPEFLAEVRKVNEEHERTLNRWEADLRRREEELRRRQEPGSGAPGE